MADEHILMLQKSFPVSMTAAVATGIEKGAVLKATDPNTASASTAANDIIAGIAYTEKIANDGNPFVLVLSGPGDELRAVASGSISMGDTLVTAVATTSPSNFLATAPINISGSQIIGRSLETATAGQTFRYVLNIGAR
ncbi:MAG: hypothetical protein AAB875_04500 [Patescibacteria group bacterium]|mgnify:CR=1 FL=1